jgi:hypothetical protein
VGMQSERRAAAGMKYSSITNTLATAGLRDRGRMCSENRRANSWESIAAFFCLLPSAEKRQRLAE